PSLRLASIWREAAGSAGLPRAQGGVAMAQAVDPGAVILEFVPVGALVRVSAMEPHTLTEVVVYGPASAGEAALRRLVLRKLDYVLQRRTRGRDRGEAS